MDTRQRSSSPGTERRADIDWLRMVGLAGVFLVHAAEPFNPWDEWHITFERRSWLLGELVVFFAPWVMPLFMFLAGGSACIALGRRTNRAYVRERALRLLLPFVAGVLLLVSPQVYLERRLDGQFEGSFFAFFPHFFDGLYPSGNLSWHHLWFLAYLFVFALVTLPLFRAFERGLGRSWLDRAARLSERPGGLLLWALPLLLGRLPPVPIARLRLPPYDFPNHALLFPMFVAGFLFTRHPGLAQALRRHWATAVPVALGLSVGMLALTWNGDPYQDLPVGRTWTYWLFGFFYTLGSWAWVVVLSGVAARLAPRFARLAGEARTIAYPFYILHQPLIVALAYEAVTRKMPTWWAFGLITSVGFLGTLALCLAAERLSLTRLLLGLPAVRPVGRAAKR